MNIKKVLYEELTPAEFRLRLADTPVAYLPLGHSNSMENTFLLVPTRYSHQNSSWKWQLSSEGSFFLHLFLGPDSMDETSGVEYYGKDRGNSSLSCRSAIRETNPYRKCLLDT